jgi:hypothetical protein
VNVYTQKGVVQRKTRVPFGKANESVNLVSHGNKGNSTTATDIAGHLRKRASDYQGSNSQLIHKLADEVEKHGSTSANDLIAKHKEIAKRIGMAPDAAHNLISGYVK